MQSKAKAAPGAAHVSAAVTPTSIVVYTTNEIPLVLEYTAPDWIGKSGLEKIAEACKAIYAADLDGRMNLEEEYRQKAADEARGE